MVFFLNKTNIHLFNILDPVTFDVFNAIIQDMCQAHEKESEAQALRDAFYCIAKSSKMKKNKEGKVCVDFKTVQAILRSGVGDDEIVTDEELRAMVIEADKDKSGTIEVDGEITSQYKSRSPIWVPLTV